MNDERGFDDGQTFVIEELLLQLKKFKDLLKITFYDDFAYYVFNFKLSKGNIESLFKLKRPKLFVLKLVYCQKEDKTLLACYNL